MVSHQTHGPGTMSPTAHGAPGFVTRAGQFDTVENCFTLYEGDIPGVRHEFKCGWFVPKNSRGEMFNGYHWSKKRVFSTPGRRVWLVSISNHILTGSEAPSTGQTGSTGRTNCAKTCLLKCIQRKWTWYREIGRFNVVCAYSRTGSRQKSRWIWLLLLLFKTNVDSSWSYTYIHGILGD